MNLDDIKNKLEQEGRMRLQVKVITGSSKPGILGEMADGTVKIGLHSAPERGRANDELVRFIERFLSPLKVRVSIVSGKTDRRKLVEIRAGL